MTNVDIDPGICGFVTRVEATRDPVEDSTDVTLDVESGCVPIMTMIADLGTAFDSYELCLVRPGKGPLYEYASTHLPPHCACPVISGITKAVEVECGLALPKDVSITFA